MYGYYKDTAFTIVAGPVGGLTPLTAGTPLKSSGYPSYECSMRDERGACDPASKESRKAMAAYFSVNAPQDSSSVALSVAPSCNRSSSTNHSQCPPGCYCNPFSVYITLCTADHCNSTSRQAEPCYLSL